MMESTARFRSLPEAALADLLTSLITDIRATLVHTGLGQGDKLLAIHRLVDAAAPPPGPEGTSR
jgi:hypothetical protein